MVDLSVAVCFGVVIWEIQKSALNYLKFDTTTEIIKSNEPEIQFPSVTFCNFNRLFNFITKWSLELSHWVEMICYYLKEKYHLVI